MILQSTDTLQHKAMLHICASGGNNSATLANAILTNKNGNDKVYLQVVYPKDFTITVANGSTGQLQKK